MASAPFFACGKQTIAASSRWSNGGLGASAASVIIAKEIWLVSLLSYNSEE